MTEGRPLRRDAQRNRDRLIAAATDLMSTRGLGVSYDDIAAAADVGVGTVYRHFPARDDLLSALFRDHIGDVIAAAADAATDTDPVAGLHRFLDVLLEQQAAHRGLAELLRGGGNAELVREASTRVTPLIVALLERTRGTGRVGPDVVPGDLVLVEFMVTAVMDASSPRDPDLWRRALALLIAGLGVQQRLPAPVPDAATIDRLYLGR